MKRIIPFKLLVFKWSDASSVILSYEKTAIVDIMDFIVINNNWSISTKVITSLTECGPFICSGNIIIDIPDEEVTEYFHDYCRTEDNRLFSAEEILKYIGDNPKILYDMICAFDIVILDNNESLEIRRMTISEATRFAATGSPFINIEEPIEEPIKEEYLKKELIVEEYKPYEPSGTTDWFNSFIK